jgi:hypothetical protein
MNQKARTGATCISRANVGGLILLNGFIGALAACSSPTDEQSFVSGIQVPTEYAACARIADDHVSASRRWDTPSYRITLETYEAGATVFRVTSAVDEKAISAGSGESCEIHINCLSGHVIKTLRYQ